MSFPVSLSLGAEVPLRELSADVPIGDIKGGLVERGRGGRGRGTRGRGARGRGMASAVWSRSHQLIVNVL